MKTLLRVLTGPMRLVRRLRYDADPYGTADQTGPSGEETMRHGSVGQSFYYPG